MTLAITPRKLDLKRDEKLEIAWADGLVSTYPIALLRRMCPCATCKQIREEDAQRKNPLRVLKGDYSKPLVVRSAQLVGNYAIRLDWSDNHDSGIYSFTYLRSISPQKSDDPPAH